MNVLKYRLAAAAASFFILAICPIAVRAETGDGLQKIRCTCYCHDGITRSGQHTREGIVAGKKEWLGKAVALYECDDNNELGDFIGYYEFLDNGAGIDTDGDGKGDSIKRGKSIDVYRYTLDDAKDWIKEYGDYVYIKIIDAEG